MSVVERARSDIAEGRLWKARDRLTGTLHQRPHEAEVIDLLGDVYLRMGDTPAAGRILMLSTREDQAAQEARRAFSALHEASAYNLAAAVPAKRPLERYPESVQARLAQIASAARVDDREVAWARAFDPPDHHASGAGIGGALVVGALGALLVLPWLVGLIYIVARLVTWIF